MSDYFIVKVDISSKQKYIFSSNKLREVIGGSEIIRFITENLGRQVLEFMGKSTEDFNGVNEGNVLSEAGGNAMYIFGNKNDAKDFNKIFSKFVMKYFDGIELVMVIQKFDMDNKRVTEVYDDIEELIKKKKGERKNQFRRLGYGLTEVCSRSGKPAGYWDKEDKEIVSKESIDKLNFYNAINEKEAQKESKYCLERYKHNLEIEKKSIKYEDLKPEGDKVPSIVKSIDNKNFEFTNALDDIAGEKDEGSYIAITCIDGNGMGDKIEELKKSIGNELPVKEFNEKYIKGFRELTESIKAKYIDAFNHTVQKIADNYDKYCEAIGFKKEKNILPIRPIILAGDDITFITNGKIAIEAARIFTEHINNRENIQYFEKKEYYLTTSAGIAIVKRNYPFSRAVKLANALEKNSKNKLREIKKDFGEIKKKDEDIYYDACLIDWQVSRGDITSDLSDLRKDELTARPYIITNEKQDAAMKLLNSLEKEEKLEKLREILKYRFQHFDKVMMSLCNTDAKSSFKSFFRTMNTNEVDAELYSLKYDLQSKIGGEFSIKELSKVLFDVIDIMDVYVFWKGEDSHE